MSFLAPFIGRRHPDTGPPAWDYSFKALARFPERLLHPPREVCKIRSCTFVPVFEISVQDVLDNKHMPPLTLKDFEEYLLFVEHAPENLYFALWLREYKAKYAAIYDPANDPVSPVTPTSPARLIPKATKPRFYTADKNALVVEFSRAKNTFFYAKSPHQLNLPQSIVNQIMSVATPVGLVDPGSVTADFTPPHPSVFDAVDKQVESMLRESITHFLLSSMANSGKYRRIFGMALGVISLLCALAPILVSIMHGKTRWMRVASLPLIFLGTTLVLASLHGVCFVIYLFGDARQLYPYELARPSFDSNFSPDPSNLASKPQSNPPTAPMTSLRTPNQTEGTAYPPSPSASIKPYGSQNDEEAAVHGIHISPVLTQHQQLSCSTMAGPTGDNTKSVTSLNQGAAIIDVVAPFAAADPPTSSDPPAPFRIIDEDEPNNYLTFITTPCSNIAPSFKDRLGITWSFEHIPRARTKSTSSVTQAKNSSTAASIGEKSEVHHPGGPLWAFSKNSPVLCPLTTVESPLITRAQWEVAVKSMVVAIVFTIALGAAILAIPSKHVR